MWGFIKEVSKLVFQCDVLFLMCVYMYTEGLSRGKVTFPCFQRLHVRRSDNWSKLTTPCVVLVVVHPWIPLYQYMVVLLILDVVTIVA